MKIGQPDWLLARNEIKELCGGGGRGDQLEYAFQAIDIAKSPDPRPSAAKFSPALCPAPREVAAL